MQRRSFLKLGLMAAAGVAAGGGLYRVLHSATPGRFTLDGEAHAVLAAIAPAMLGGALAATEPQRSMDIAGLVRGVQLAIAGLPLAQQKEVQDLFGLLALAPARRLLAGIKGGWGEATAAQVAVFLQDWRLHRFATLQTAYLALHDLMLGAWYGDAGHWAAIGYPGPLPELSPAP